jgi:Bacterial Ig-like domain
MNLAPRILTQSAALASLLALTLQARAQLTVSVTAPGSTTAPAVFTFNEAMDTNATTAQFIVISNPMNPPQVTSSWNASLTVLTCTPVQPWPANTAVTYVVEAQSQTGDSLDNPLSGYGTFTAGSGGGNTGSGTNRITVCSVGVVHTYNQDSSAAPTLDTNAPYGFLASTAVASNVAATAVSVTLPTSVVKSLSTPIRNEDYVFYDFSSNLTTFNAAYPAGDYAFQITATPQNQQTTATLPATTDQPNAPHVTNWSAVQAVNPSQPFVLTWDPFVGATANDFISVDVSGDTGRVFFSGGVGDTNVIKGTATSVTIPAGKLQTSSSYDLVLTFYRWTGHTNDTIAAFGFRATATDLGLVTSVGGTAVQPVISEPVLAGNALSFNVTASAGETLVLESSPDLTPGSWTAAFTTNSPGTQVQITAPVSSAPKQFYRLRVGP